MRLHSVNTTLLILVVLTVINIIQLWRFNQYQLVKPERNKLTESNGLHQNGEDYRNQKPVYLVHAKNPDGGYLNHVFIVLDRLGFARGSEQSSPQWDLLWHHDYPFLDEQMRPILMDLKPHQKVNHIPGSGYYTSKVNLAVSNISGIPPAFDLPAHKDRFLEFAAQHPDKLWIQKSDRHRGIQIKPLSALDLTQENSFIQEYIANPLLIDGRKFDIGIYTIVTSVLPLRVYLYEGEALLRFCGESYHPFDASNVNKYVVGDDYTPTWKMDSLAKYFTDSSFTHKESLNAYLRAKGLNANRIWQQIRHTIRQVLTEKEYLFVALASKFKHGSLNFFELSRFDFVLDSDLNVYLMEANMSPNLSSGHFPENKLLYEQVLYNLLNLVGIARHIHAESLKERSSDELQMRVSDKDISVYADDCVSSTAQCQSCHELKCKLCSRCLSDERQQWLRMTYLEHINRRNTRRIIPQPLPPEWIKSEQRFVDEHLSFLLTDDDKLLALWFRGKCLQDSSWCD